MSEYLVKYKETEHNMAMLAWQAWRRRAVQRGLGAVVISEIFGEWTRGLIRLIVDEDDIRDLL